MIDVPSLEPAFLIDEIDCEAIIIRGLAKKNYSRYITPRGKIMFERIIRKIL